MFESKFLIRFSSSGRMQIEASNLNAEISLKSHSEIPWPETERLSSSTNYGPLLSGSLWATSKFNSQLSIHWLLIALERNQFERSFMAADFAAICWSFGFMQKPRNWRLPRIRVFKHSTYEVWSSNHQNQRVFLAQSCSYLRSTKNCTLNLLI